MKRLLSLLILLLAMGVAVPAPAVTGEDGTGHGKYHSKKHHRKGYFFYKAISKLELSPKQKTELAKLRLSYKKEKIEAESRIKILEVELRELLLEGEIDMDSIKEKLEEIERERTALRLNRYRALKEFLSILTPKQRKQFRAMLLYSIHE